MWNEEEDSLLSVFNTYLELPAALNKIILLYCPPVQWNKKPIKKFKIPTPDKHCQPTGFIHIPQLSQIFLCTSSERNPLLCYTLKGELIKNHHQSSSSSSSLPVDNPRVIEIDESTGYLYIIDRYHITIINVQKEVINQWILPESNTINRGLKIDNNIVYLTLFRNPKIYLYTKEGKMITTFEKNKKNEFQSPVGLTIYKQQLYICDYDTQRVVVLDKKEGHFITQWGTSGTENGQFVHPQSIYLSLERGMNEEGILYIGDKVSVQLFTIDGFFLQRLGGRVDYGGTGLGEFRNVLGIGICEGYLYVSDFFNNRIQVFRKDQCSIKEQKKSIFSRFFSS